MAGGIQVLRVEKRSRVNGAVAAHVLGEHVHEVHEVPPDQELDIRILVDDRDRVAAYLAGLRVHGNASPGVEFVIAGCRSEWTREEQDAYFVRSFQWIRDKAGPHTDDLGCRDPPPRDKSAHAGPDGCGGDDG